MTENLKKISDLIDNQEDLENEKKFKVASASLVCSIVDVSTKEAKKYCSLFEKNLNLGEEEFLQIKEQIEQEGLSLDKKIVYIKNELNNNMYQIMQFLRILNKFAIIDGCKQESYREFENIRDKFLKEYY